MDSKAYIIAGYDRNGRLRQRLVRAYDAYDACLAACRLWAADIVSCRAVWL